MDYEFKRTRIDKIPKKKLIEELERVAGLFNYTEYGKRDFNKLAKISHNPIIKEFGSWSSAIDALREHLKNKNIELKTRKKYFISNKQLFDEMERIWKIVGHRPSKTEWQSCDPKYSLQPYKTRFNGWQNACLQFIEYKMGKEIEIETKILEKKEILEKKRETKIKKEDKRTIPLKLRLNVLNRDNFRCVYCGRSPATDIGVVLHIDHIVPFSKGGKTTLNNLQTLCSKCNLGKSDSQNISK